jgi:hypothetical protein
VQRLLRTRNQHLLRDLQRLRRSISDAPRMAELLPYTQRIEQALNHFATVIEQNLADLGREQAVLTEDIMNATQQAINWVRLLSSHFVRPITRASEVDRLSLRVISWLHAQSPRTANFPAAVADGDCAIYPFIQLCPIYFFPTTEKQTLLYLPLYFHEYGHLLYACHKRELDDLVAALRQEVEIVLTPPSFRSDRHAEIQSSRRQEISLTWYKWAQEFFCDAVGLAIGGSAYLNVFSMYLGGFDRGDFYRPRAALAHSTHPVTWLRVKVLASRATKLNLGDEATTMLEEWQSVAETKGVVEDYHGFYDDTLSKFLHQTIDDMLVETLPTTYDSTTALDERMLLSGASPVTVVRHAWQQYSTKSSDDYEKWEQDLIRVWLNTS